MVPIDTAASKQRRGRAGRLGPGNFHPMIAAKPLKPYKPNLTRIVLHIAEFGWANLVAYLERLHDDEFGLFGFPSHVDCLLRCQWLQNDWKPFVNQEIQNLWPHALRD